MVTIKMIECQINHQDSSRDTEVTIIALTSIINMRHKFTNNLDYYNVKVYLYICYSN